MSTLKAATLFAGLAKIADPRREHQRFHALFDILVMAICAVLCGAEHWTERQYEKAVQESLIYATVSLSPCSAACRRNNIRLIRHQYSAALLSTVFS